MELAEHKSTRFPGLEKVEIRESGHQVEWQYPEDLMNAFETAGIHLFIVAIEG
jgi:hypothetical protein